MLALHPSSLLMDPPYKPALIQRGVTESFNIISGLLTNDYFLSPRFIMICLENLLQVNGQNYNSPQEVFSTHS